MVLILLYIPPFCGWGIMVPLTINYTHMLHICLDSSLAFPDNPVIVIGIAKPTTWVLSIKFVPCSTASFHKKCERKISEQCVCVCVRGPRCSMIHEAAQDKQLKGVVKSENMLINASNVTVGTHFV